MAQELTLRLNKPIEELIPAMIAFNNAELLVEVKDRLATYQGRIYDETSISAAKADRATLNKFMDALNSERLRIKKVYTAPLDKFTAEVNEVIDTVKVVMLEIDGQVKTYTEKQKAEKLVECKEYFASVLPAELAGFIRYEKIHKDEWLNASKKMPAVKKDIDAIIEKIKAELVTIEALGSDTTELKAMYFEGLSLTDTITAYERRKAEKQRIEQAKAEAERIAAEKKNAEPTPEKQPETVAQVEEPAKLFTIAFKVTGTAEQLNALKAYMSENGLKIERA
ncbi:MAG: DUF1351 domain-containing protein [Clostridiales bacterium]|nr:DUF1351 domain-containing protein [Clostridiales bacterium]